jgi:hypothetical protein
MLAKSSEDVKLNSHTCDSFLLATNMSEKLSEPMEKRSKVYTVAGQEALEDQQLTTSQHHSFGTLEVRPLLHSSTPLTPSSALHQRILRHKLLLPPPMFLGSRRRNIPILACKWRTRIHRLWQHFLRHRHHTHRLVARGDDLHGPNRRCAISLVRSICSKIQ